MPTDPKDREMVEVLPIRDWQWLADQLRAWPERRVHPERTMCEGVLRPMAAAVIEDALSRLTTPTTGASALGEVAEALRWYGEQTRLARLIHSEGDAGRHALQADGGKRAVEALASVHTPDSQAMRLVHAMAYRYKNGNGLIEDIARCAFSWMQEANRIVSGNPVLPDDSEDEPVQKLRSGIPRALSIPMGAARAPSPVSTPSPQDERVARLEEALRAVELARHTDDPADWRRATDLSDAALSSDQGGEAGR